ncbi:MAG: V-type ATP synthase subunit D [Kiritimatiellae bacterium]|nr:V-type ATP synthase subunit D [Kiritimatiellia bacterium]
MAKIKHTKNELKAQRDALKRFQRYLPTLQLKKQQLQLEVRTLEAKVDAAREEERSAREDLSKWVKLFSEPVDLSTYLRVRAVRTEEGNIAGVAVPLYEGVDFDRTVPDLYETPVWVDDGLAMLETLIRLRVQRTTMEEGLRRLAGELRVTNQRVNLFEKVKIPQCQEHIRMIRIFLGDQQTAGVARAKIAKAKTSERESAA